MKHTDTAIIPEKDDLFLKYWNKVGCCICLEGEAHITINAHTYPLKRGSLYFFTPMIQIQHLTPGDGFKSITFMEDVKVFFPTFHTVIDSGIPLYIREHPYWEIAEEEITFLEEQQKRILQKRELLKTLSVRHESIILEQQMQLIIKETVLEIVFNYFHHHPFTPSSFNRHSFLIYNFMTSLLRNYRSERSVRFYAEESQLSTGHFTHIVKSATGKTPSEWAVLFTITNAKNLLEKSDLRIKEIAEELHFPEQFTFRKYFKRHTGISPKEFRMRNVRKQ